MAPDDPSAPAREDRAPDPVPGSASGAHEEPWQGQPWGGPPWGAGPPPWVRGRRGWAGPRRVVAGVLALVAVLGTFGAVHRQPLARDLDLLAVLLILVAPVVLATLVQRAALATGLSVGAAVVYLWLGYPWGPVFLPVVAVLFVVLLTGPDDRRRWLAWGGAAGLLVGAAASGLVRADPLPVGALVAGSAWAAVVLLLAGAARERAARIRAQRSAVREREAGAVAAERLRIARELHDVLAHSLSAINVQAGVGLHLIDRDPEQARQALAAIRSTSHDALDEVREVLGVVRAEGAAPRTPSWDLGGLAALAEPLRQRGIQVTVDVSLDPSTVPERHRQVAFRVVQEALTNVGRHAPAARQVDVVVTGGADVELAVEDDGGPGAEPTPGFGLTGMRERVESLGGTLEAGPGERGFRVHARLPLGGAS